MIPYYQDEQVTIYCGDCRDVLPTLARADHVITDPPYDAKTHAGAVTTSDPTKDYGVSFDALSSPSELARLLLQHADRWVLAFCAVEQIGAYASGAGDAWVRSGVWDKIAPAPQITGDRPGQAVEAIAIMHKRGKKRWNGGGCAAIWRHLPPHGSDRPEHPTPKPEPLMLELVTLFTNPGESILDPFMGSGTTLAAAKRVGRKAIGIEINEAYCEVAARRLSQGSLAEMFL